MNLNTTPTLPSLQILLAEDNPVNQRVAQLLLRKLGQSIDIANNGIEAIAALHHQSYDIVLMDCEMPEMDGFTASRKIRDTLAKSEQPYIIAMTANSMDGDRERCLAAGMDDYVAKPISAELLSAALERGIAARIAVPSAEPVDFAELAPTDFDRPALDAFITNFGMADAAEIIGDYLDMTPALLEQLGAAIAKNDAPLARRVAHDLKSTSASFGATACARTAASIEARAAKGAATELSALYAELRLHFEGARRILARVRQSKDS